MLVDPCPCARNREAAMSCPRTPTGSLVWHPTSQSVANGAPLGPAEIVTPDGRREPLIFDSANEWEHYSKRLARDHALIRHLVFEVARG